MSSPASSAENTWQQAKALFEAAMAIGVDQRAEFVRQHATTAEVVAEVLALLAHTTDARGAPSGLESARMTEASRSGQRLGAWQLSHVLGSGGMGEVWLAERADGSYVGEAAVKVLKRGMDSASVLARFDLERQSLARLDHPHIARLLDAGITPDGLPYFVMEHVAGLPIDKASTGMDVSQRLAVFLQLADAVAHAHRNLLVHRDLKPGNVLLNAQGQVKLLDFGIAKALDASGDLGEQTRAEERVLTPSYASPEQVRGEPVTTATDIYSLGVLLYVLLTGVRPYARDTRTPHEIAEAVLHAPPSKPSGLSAQHTLLPDWERTRRRLAGDLDNILLKSLAKLPQERYASVDAFAADIRAHLSGHPVSARPQSWRYSAVKFVGRNKLLVGLASTAVVALIGGAAAVAWQAKRADEQRALAEQRFEDVYQFARTSLFEVDTALRTGPTAGREKLVSTSQKYLEKLASDEKLAQAKPELLRDIAEAYERIGDIQGGDNQANLGRPDDARKSYERATTIRERFAQAAPNDLRNVNGLIEIYKRLGDQNRVQVGVKAALPYYQKTAEMAQRLAALQPDDLSVQVKHIESQRYLASVYFRPFFPSLGDFATGKRMLEALVPQAESLLQRHPGKQQALESLNTVYNQWQDQLRMEGRHEELLAVSLKSWEVMKQLIALDPQNPRLLRFAALTLGRVGEGQINGGQIETGLATMKEALAKHQSNAAADAGNERAQRNVANAYGILVEQTDWLERDAEALKWSTLEFELLTEMRAKHPQVKFLIGRLDEAARDYAVYLALNGKLREAATQQRQLQSRMKDDFAQAPKEPEDAKLQVQRARVWGMVARGKEPGAPQEFAAALPLAIQGIELLKKSAEERPYDTIRASEHALGAMRLADVLAPSDQAQACGLYAKAHQSFEKLSSSKKLSSVLVKAAQSAGNKHANCGPKTA